MGKEEEKQRRIDDLGGYKITEELMALANDDAIFMHCLHPAQLRGRLPQSSTGRRASSGTKRENRLHAQKALLAWLLEQQRAHTVA